ncbi:MAG: alpha/beta fold hydrolase [Vicinamibacterales bacterium]
MTDTASPRSPWLVRYGPDTAGVRLIGFPHAGGAASAFYPWRAELQPDIVVHGVQLPGREDRWRERPVRDVDDVLGPVAEAVTALDARPFVLFGHSLGAVLAFELARSLRRAGRPGPAALIVSARPAPHVLSRAPSLAHLPPAALVERVSAVYGGVPAAVRADPELVALMGRALQADLALLERHAYVSDEPLDCPVVACGGVEDPWVASGELDAWRQHSTGRFTRRDFAGGHFYFRSPEAQAGLLAVVRECGRAAG